ncbi:TPA: hypothetical protein QIC26_003634 [Klebsiella aerogenes]|nr:hypothetical protein [Klebsiella aerogenes]HDU3928627.1 hypothetical protein [Klebsiella aerogenes]
MYAVADGPVDSYANRTNFRWAAFSVDGAGNVANLYLLKLNASLIPATIAAGANLATRDITEAGASSLYRLIAFRSPTIPPNLSGTDIDVAEVLVFDSALNFAALQRTYARSQAYQASFGQGI